MEKFAIRMTFPGGGRIGDGLLTAGNSYPPPVAPWYGREAAEEAAAYMRSLPINKGYTFEVVPYPTEGGA